LPTSRGGEVAREKVRGTKGHIACQKYNMNDCLPGKLYKTPIKTTFRVWFLCSYLVHGSGLLLTFQYCRIDVVLQGRVSISFEGFRNVQRETIWPIQAIVISAAH
jgi:hypothetical protein